MRAGVGLVRRSQISIVRPCGAGKDTTPAAFLLACASGAEKPSPLASAHRGTKKNNCFTRPRGLMPVFASGGFGRCGIWAPTRETESGLKPDGLQRL